MDFKRIEWIFFFAFLGLNLFLFNLYREAKIEQNITYRTNETIPIQKRLSSENIRYEEEFSNDKLQGYYLSGVQTDFNQALLDERTRLNKPQLLEKQTTIAGGNLAHTLETPVILDNESQINAETIDDILTRTDLFLFGKEYQYLADASFIADDYSEIVTGQFYEDIPLNDASGRLTMILERVEDQWLLTKYVQSHVSDLAPLREAMLVYSESDIINTLYVNNRIPVNSTIMWRQLAYKMTLKVRGQAIYVPTWFVAIETTDGKTRIELVNGFTNRIVTNSVVQTVENQ
ncbi:two-component system regulatory protein YycI [Enterococcus aquimarinus]|uniref:two-component system regulatory protein YycI n=1 Tax=Enterococcus TaxID=1350 RepID=UPI0008FFF1AB|nr:two-component system regulatory protein YycI [Enterococcus aquimarinus]